MIKHKGCHILDSNTLLEIRKYGYMWDIIVRQFGVD